MRELYAIVDEITNLWSQVEQAMVGPPFKEDGFPLSLERVNSDKVRLCYSGRPMNECSLEVRIVAAEHLGDLRKRVTARNQRLLDDARVARAKLVRWLDGDDDA